VLSGRLEKTRKAHAKNLFGQRKNRGWKAFDFELKGATLFYTRSNKGDNVPQKIDLSRASSIVYIDGDKDAFAPEIQVVMPEVHFLCYVHGVFLFKKSDLSKFRRTVGLCISVCPPHQGHRQFLPGPQPPLKQPQHSQQAVFLLARNFTIGLQPCKNMPSAM
jgi:hypothetical protein